jgi:lipopolysaccharide export system protein LptA
MTNPNSLLLLLVALVFSSAALAEKADRNKPMNVESDTLRYDDLKQTSVFSGKVVLTKGTILIRGAKIDVRQDPEGYQFGLITAEPGKLAFFRQKREGLDEFIEGEAETIEYDSRADTVKFIQSAQLRRYQGAQLNDELAGAVILYNNTTDVFTIDGASAKNSPGAPPGRVRAMLTPKPAPVVSGPAPGTPLRDSPALGGGKK